MPAPRSLVGDFLAQHLGAEAVQTLKVRHTSGDIHGLIYIHAEASARMLKLFSKGGELGTPSKLALKGLVMHLSVKFEGAPAVPEEVKDEVNPEMETLYFNGMPLRVYHIDGEPWFYARDAYTAIGLSRHGGLLDRLNSDEKVKRGRTSLGLGKGNAVWLISESGLYKFITRSDKPEAKPFQEWVTRDVLPSIRKTGSYSVSDGVEREPEQFAPALTGEVIPAPKKLIPDHLIEDAYLEVVQNRRTENLKRAIEVRTELQSLERSIAKDEKMLALLAA